MAKSGGVPVTLISRPALDHIAVGATSVYFTDGWAVWKLTPK